MVFSLLRLVVSCMLLAAGTMAVPSLPSPNPSVKPLLAAAGTPIAGQYIVVCKDVLAAGAMNTLISTLTLAGALEKFRYTSVFNGFTVSGVSGTILNTIRSSGIVQWVEQDSLVNSTQQTQLAAPWGLDRIDQRSSISNSQYQYYSTGQGVSAYILDTGIRLTHQEFEGRAKGNTEGYSAFGSSTDDNNGHGTHVAGIVGGKTYGVAKKVTLYAVKVLDDDGSGSTSGVIAGVNWVTANHRKPAVACMSLGGGGSTSLDAAVRSSVTAGVTYAVAAGNDNEDACGTSPARESSAITVGAISNGDSKATYSNHGPCVDMFAPGSSIISAWYTSDSATKTLSGTSMAAPFVAGSAALLRELGSSSPQDDGGTLLCRATKDGLNGVGSGSPNILLFAKTQASELGQPQSPGAAGETCAGACNEKKGSLSPGQSVYLPSNAGFNVSGSGAVRFYVNSTDSLATDLDLFLYKENSGSWELQARTTGLNGGKDSLLVQATTGWYLAEVRSQEAIRSAGYSALLKQPSQSVTRRDYNESSCQFPSAGYRTSSMSPALLLVLVVAALVALRS